MMIDAVHDDDWWDITVYNTHTHQKLIRKGSFPTPTYCTKLKRHRGGLQDEEYKEKCGQRGFNLSHSRELGKQRYSNTSMWTHNEQRDSLNTKIFTKRTVLGRLNSWTRDQIQKKVLEVRLELTTCHESWVEDTISFRGIRVFQRESLGIVTTYLGFIRPTR